MSRRPGRGTAVGFSSLPDPGLILGPTAAWYASDAATSGGNVTSIPNRIGGGPAMTPAGTYAAPAAVTQLGGQLGVGGYYTSSLSITSPAGITFAWVGYEPGVVQAGQVVTTVGGTANTAQSLFRDGATQYDRNISGATVDASTSSALTARILVGTIATGFVSRLYVNARTAVVSGGAVASMVSSTVSVIGALDNVGAYFAANTRWARAAIWNRALAQAEVEYLLTAWGVTFGISIAA